MNKKINNSSVTPRFKVLDYVLELRRGGKQFLPLSSTFMFPALATEVRNQNS